MLSRLPSLLAFCASVVFFCTAPAWAQDWQAAWVTENQQALDPKTSITLQIPADLSAQVINSLAVEVDGFDLTSYTAIGEGSLQLSPPVPFEAGSHEMRLVEYGGSQIIERGRWLFTVLPTRAKKTLEGSLNATLAQRLGSDGLMAPKPPVTTAHGSLDLNSSIAKDNWELRAQVNSLFNSQDDQMVSGDHAEGNILLSGLVSGESLDVEGRLGRHNIGADNLLISNFDRRGASLTTRTKGDRFALSVFAQKPEDDVSYDNLVGLSENNHRLAGTHITLRPFERWKESFIVTGSYYDGEGQNFSTNGFGVDHVDASGYSFGAQSYWFDNRLYLGADYAHNSTDYGFGESDNEAYSALVRYDLVRDHMVNDSPLNLALGLQYNRIGTFYHSLANQGFVEDQDSTLLYSEIYWGGLSGQLQVNRLLNNVDDLEMVPTDRIWDYRVTSNYVPNWQSPPRWLGSPSFYLNANVTEGDRKKTPLGFVGFDYDEEQRGVATGLTASYDGWSWSLGYGHSTYDDNTNVASDRVENSVDFAVSLYKSPKFSLNPSLRWVRAEDQDLGFEDDYLDLGLNGQVLWIPDTLDTSFNLGANLQDGDNAFSDLYTVSTETNWTFRKPDANRPGFALAMSAAYQENQFVIGNDLDQFQAFARLKLIMPVAFGR